MSIKTSKDPEREKAEKQEKTTKILFEVRGWIMVAVCIWMLVGTAVFWLSWATRYNDTYPIIAWVISSVIGFLINAQSELFGKYGLIAYIVLSGVIWALVYFEVIFPIR